MGCLRLGDEGTDHERAKSEDELDLGDNAPLYYV